MANIDTYPDKRGSVLLRTFVYGRVSSKDQINKKYIINNKNLTDTSGSVKEQPRLCKDFIVNYKGTCPKCGSNLSPVLECEYFDEGKSGTNDDRDGIDMIMEKGSGGEIDLVLVAENDRLGRNLYETQGIRNELIKMGVQVNSVKQSKQLYCPTCYSPYEDDSGVAMDMFSDFKSHTDLSRIMRNYKVGMNERVRRGLPPGSMGYGLVKTKDEIKNGARIQEYAWDEQKVSIVKRIIHEYMDQGLGMWKISQRLNEENIPSSQDKKWGRTGIKCILNNPIYAGYVRYKWKTAGIRKGVKVRTIQPKNKWVLEKAIWHKDKLWDMSYFEEIHRTIQLRKGMGGRASGSNALLIGLLKCGYCGYSMFQAHSSKVRDNGDVYKWRGYMCGTYAHRGACQHNGSSQKKIDDLVIKEILKLADNPKSRETYIKRLESQKEINTKEVLSEKGKIFSELSKRLNRASDAYLAGEFNLEEYSKEKKELIPRISQLELEIEQLRNNPSRERDKIIPDYVEIVEKIRKEYEKGNIKNLQLLLRKIIEKIEFQKKPVNVKITFNGSSNY